MFAYQSRIEASGSCCIALVFLHSPIHLALESRPPHITTQFSLEQWQTQSDVAVSFHFLHTVSLTFRGEKTGFETPKEIAGTILPAFILRVFVSWRLHFGDLRVGTLLAKALLLGKNGNHVLDSSLMRVKALNKFCRRHDEEASYTVKSFLDRLLYYISASSDDEETIVNEVYTRLVSKNSGKTRDIDSDYMRLKDDYFKDQSEFIIALKAKIDEPSTKDAQKKKRRRIVNLTNRLKRHQ